jgi:hypothetical protein
LLRQSRKLCANLLRRFSFGVLLKRLHVLLEVAPVSIVISGFQCRRLFLYSKLLKRDQMIDGVTVTRFVFEV